MAMAVCETMVATTFNAQANPYPIVSPREMAKKMAPSRLPPPTFVFLFFFPPILPLPNFCSKCGRIGHRVADCRKGKKDGDSGERREKKGDGPAAVAVMRKATTKEGGMGRQSEDGWLFTGRSPDSPPSRYLLRVSSSRWSQVTGLTAQPLPAACLFPYCSPSAPSLTVTARPRMEGDNCHVGGCDSFSPTPMSSPVEYPNSSPVDSPSARNEAETQETQGTSQTVV
nr:hypothetical protein Iba_chr14dCG2360 [Ipomoea batatas]